MQKEKLTGDQCGDSVVEDKKNQLKIVLEGLKSEKQDLEEEVGVVNTDDMEN